MKAYHPFQPSTAKATGRCRRAWCVRSGADLPASPDLDDTRRPGSDA